MKHSEAKNKKQYRLIAQIPVSLQKEYELTFTNT